MKLKLKSAMGIRKSAPNRNKITVNSNEWRTNQKFILIQLGLGTRIYTVRRSRSPSSIYLNVYHAYLVVHSRTHSTFILGSVWGGSHPINIPCLQLDCCYSQTIGKEIGAR